MNNDLFNDCVTKIRLAGQRITKPKLEILKLLITSRSGLDITDLIKLCDELGSEIDRVTVYRVIEAFEKLGIVHKAGKNNSYMVCQHVNCKSAHHCITECIKCGVLSEFDLNTDLVQSLKKQVRLASGNTLKLDHLQVSVLCAKCS